MPDPKPLHDLDEALAAALETAKANGTNEPESSGDAPAVLWTDGTRWWVTATPTAPEGLDGAGVRCTDALLAPRFRATVRAMCRALGRQVALPDGLRGLVTAEQYGEDGRIGFEFHAVTEPLTVGPAAD